MPRITTLSVDRWAPTNCAPDVLECAAESLEQGNILFFPQLGFQLGAAEQAFLSPETAGKSKNVSWDGAASRLRGSNVGPALQPLLQGMMQRFAAAGESLLGALFPAYQGALVTSRTSFRAVEVAGRSTSWRKDDTRLHVDSFPSTPVQGKRILRLFSNVNPHGQARSWRLGGSFEAVAEHFLPTLTAPPRGSARLLQWCSITRGYRTAYDHYMLQLHDRMKADGAYQSSADVTGYDFPAQSTWLVFTDQVPHAVVRGQYLLEQTFYLPVDAMRDPERAPLRILEQRLARPLT